MAPIEFNMDDRIFVYDKSTLGILCSANSYTHAYAIVSGLLNARTHSYFKKERLDYNFNFDDPHSNYKFNDTDSNIEILSDKFITPEWINLRILIIEKANSLAYWEHRCKKVNSRLDEYYSAYLSSYLNSELLKCDPEKNFYTQSIYEYAYIQEISVETAYQELNMKNESLGLAHMRNYAVYLKGVREINQQQTCEDVQKKLHEYLRGIVPAFNSNKSAKK